MECQICNKQNSDDLSYCEECGSELSRSAAAHPGLASSQPSGDALSEPATREEAGFAEDTANVPVPASVVGDPTALGPAGALAPAMLVIKRNGAATGEALVLEGERHLVGRFDPSTGPVDIDVSAVAGAEHVSRRHAEIYRDGVTWMVRDLGSTSGTFVKRRGEPTFSARLQAPSPLAGGDEVAFANVAFIFEEKSA